MRVCRLGVRANSITPRPPLVWRRRRWMSRSGTRRALYIYPSMYMYLSIYLYRYIDIDIDRDSYRYRYRYIYNALCVQALCACK